MHPTLRLLAFLTFLIAALPAAAQSVPYKLRHVIPAPPVGTQTGAGLGSSVAMDGGYTVVGAPYDDAGAVDAGVVKVLDSATGALLFILPSPEPHLSHAFGWSVAISGTRVAVGVPFHDLLGASTGRVYVYDLAGATPTVPVATLEAPSPVAFDYFGYSGSISGPRLLVGA